MLTIFLRSVILYAASLLAMRAMGKRQVGQLQPFELVVVIMIAELAATPMGGVGIPILYGLLPMAALVVCHGLLTALCMKSERVRVWLCGQPTVLVRNGVICEKQLRACAEAALQKCRNVWKQKVPWLQTLINHDDVDAVTTALKKIEAGISSRELPLCLEACAELGEHAEHLYHRDALTLGNVL